MINEVFIHLGKEAKLLLRRNVICPVQTSLLGHDRLINEHELFYGFSLL